MLKDIQHALPAKLILHVLDDQLDKFRLSQSACLNKRISL